MAKREKKKKKKGGAVAGVGALLIAALLAFDPFGFGFGEGFGLGLPVSGNNQDEGDKENDGDGQEELCIGRGVSPSNADPIVIYKSNGEAIYGDALYAYTDLFYGSSPIEWNYLGG